jgi:hypothetical protein
MDLACISEELCENKMEKCAKLWSCWTLRMIIESKQNIC